MQAPSSLIGFYEGTLLHPSGCSFEEILDWSDERLEDSHDVVQWLFPTATPSLAHPQSPVAVYADVQAFLGSEALRSKQLAALDRFLAFYGFERKNGDSLRRRIDFPERAEVWMESRLGGTPHNYLRITRILRSLQLLGSYETALKVQAAFLQVAEEFSGSVDAETIHFWVSAVSPDGPDGMGPNGVAISAMRFADETDLPMQSVSVEALAQVGALQTHTSTQARIDAVAADLPTGVKFRLVPADHLAASLGIDLSGDCDEYAEIAERMDIEYFAFDQIAEYLEDILPPERVDEIRESGEFDPSEIEDRDRVWIEQQLTLAMLGEFNGDYPWVNKWNAVSSGGIAVSFFRCQGEGGSLSGLFGPYEARRFDSPGDDDGYVVSDFEPF